MVTKEEIFVDTSAFYALMDRSYNRHEEAAHLWASLMEEDEHLRTSNYIIVETTALVQSRLGFEAAHLWHRDILSVVEMLWVNSQVHEQASVLWRSLGRRQLSLVDCVSFVTMRELQLEKAFAFDTHFEEQGFEVLRLP